MFKGITKIHFIGIGGIGMSGIAELLLNLGFEVSGSDVANSETVERLKKLGARINIGHKAENLGSAQVVVYSSAVAIDNPECMKAKEKGLPVIPRAEMLAELMRMKYSIAIAGTHGKTTTTSMLAIVLAKAGLDPTAVIGGKLDIFDSNARLGDGEILVAEADESDKSFLKLSPIITAVTNIEEEHMDYYHDLDDIKDTYTEFLNKVPFYGFNMLCIDDKNIQEIIPRVKRRVITYGSLPQAHYRYEAPRFKGRTSWFKVYKGDNLLGKVKIEVPGLHNCLNALAVIGIATELGISFDLIQDGLSAFSGVQRRFHVRGEEKGIMVVDDYGHHPTEIKKTLKAVKTGFSKRRIVAVFQPHRYTRTRDFFNAFIAAFDDADKLYITEIYPASETPIDGISGLKLYEGIKAHAHSNIVYVEDKNHIPEKLIKDIKDQDIVIFLGAGDIWRQGIRLLEMLK